MVVVVVGGGEVHGEGGPWDVEGGTSDNSEKKATPTRNFMKHFT